jgi:hypothetical protein
VAEQGWLASAARCELRCVGAPRQAGAGMHARGSGTGAWREQVEDELGRPAAGAHGRAR